MSYYEQAKGINTDLVNLFNSIPIAAFTKDQRESILNIIIRFGQIAKFRCRSNTAYDNFVQICLQDIAEIRRVDNGSDEFKPLRAFMKEVDHK